MAGWFYADIDFSDVNRTIGDIKKYSGKTVLRIEAAVNQSVKAIASRTRQNAPKGPTGNLRKNIRTLFIDRNKYGPEGWAFAKGGKGGAPHAHLVELGVKKSVAKPLGSGRTTKKGISLLGKDVMKFSSGGRTQFAKSATIPARSGKPFMAPAYEAEKQNTIDRIKAAIDGRSGK